MCERNRSDESSQVQQITGNDRIGKGKHAAPREPEQKSIRLPANPFLPMVPIVQLTATPLSSTITNCPEAAFRHL